MPGATVISFPMPHMRRPRGAGCRLVLEFDRGPRLSLSLTPLVARKARSRAATPLRPTEMVDARR